MVIPIPHASDRLQLGKRAHPAHIPREVAGSSGDARQSPRGASRKALLSPVIVHIDGRAQRDRLPVEDVARPVRLPAGAGFGRRTPQHPKTRSLAQDEPAVLG